MFKSNLAHKTGQGVKLTYPRGDSWKQGHITTLQGQTGYNSNEMELSVDGHK